MKGRSLVFVDDDPEELESVRKLLGSKYDLQLVHWPLQRISGRPPDIFVLDLYLPSAKMGEKQMSSEAIREQADQVQRIAANLPVLYSNHAHDGKRLLRETMTCLSELRKVLDAQVKALGQSPGNGLRLLASLKKRYPGVPVVFYSRKITPEDVVTVLKAGAADAIRKRALSSSQLIARLEQAQRLYGTSKALRLGRAGRNINVTLSKV